MISVLELFVAFILGNVVAFLAFYLACLAFYLASFSGDNDNEREIEEEEICKYCEYKDCSSCGIRNKDGEV